MPEANELKETNPRTSVLSLANLAASVLLGIGLIVVFLWPEWLTPIGISPLQGQWLVMGMVVLNLLLAAVNPRVSLPLRVFGLLGALITTIETILMMKG